ncbi:MAG: DEAD/DEAH box helicase [Candidatus Coatesbacteria bacterium]|nr:DEAD/DEAH box helicase [Candidatus Coatesbacteria bacterium]
MENKPLIVQSDMTMLLETKHPDYEDARQDLAFFAELLKSPEYFHTYRITPISLWNAASSGLTAENILMALKRYSRYELPQAVEYEIKRQISRYGKIKLVKKGKNLLLTSDEKEFLDEIWNQPRIRKLLAPEKSEKGLIVLPENRGEIKQALIKIGFPIKDLAGYDEGTSYPMATVPLTKQGYRFKIRFYQAKAVDMFLGYYNKYDGGSGVIVLPCGAGKTIVGIAAMTKLKTYTLILSTNIVALRQWKDEILDKTNIIETDIGEYSGEKKEIKPITLVTYQILTYRGNDQKIYPHFKLFNKENWGLIIYDEVHLLPAPVFRITASIQAKRRLGLTATLVREDGHEDDVFSLIGPKRFDMSWKELEKKGYIAEATCVEVRIPLPQELRIEYSVTESRHDRFRMAAENVDKITVLEELLDFHAHDQVLIIGQFLGQLNEIAERFSLEILTGKTPTSEREELYRQFREGEINHLVVSKVANFAVDLPDANVAIQISGTFGSRQEEAQRLGRILRPKRNGGKAIFYTLVSSDTSEETFSAKRQTFLTEQGYQYIIREAGDLRLEELEDLTC